MVLLVIVAIVLVSKVVSLLMSSVLLVMSLRSSVPLVKLQTKLSLLLLNSIALVDTKSTKQIIKLC